MKEFLLVTAVGPDQPGLVAAMTGVLAEAGCNLEDATMTRLRGDFAMMFLARRPEGGTAVLEESLQDVGREHSLDVRVRALSAAEAGQTGDEGLSFHVVVYGADHPGIVHGVSRRLAERGANITDLRTAIGGTEEKPIYIMQIEVQAPPEEDPDAFRAALGETANDLGVDLDVQLLDPVAL